MLKLNDKGFVLVETLIVSVFVMGLFTLMYTNFYPLMGEYEKREHYDDMESLYDTYMIKKSLENDGIISLLGEDFVVLDRSSYRYETSKNYYEKLKEKNNLIVAIITNYNITNLKENINNNIDSINTLKLEEKEAFKEYILSLSNYEEQSGSLNLRYRVIAMYKDDSNAESETNAKPIYKYATIGVE